MASLSRRSARCLASVLSKAKAKLPSNSRKAARSPRARECAQALIFLFMSVLLGAWAWSHSKEEGSREGARKSRPTREAWEKLVKREGLVPRENAQLEHRLQSEGIPLPPGAPSAAWMEPKSRWVVIRVADEGMGRVLWFYAPSLAKKTMAPFQEWTFLGEDGPGLFHLQEALEKGRPLLVKGRKQTSISTDPREVSY